jgi:hypothetical protein
MKRVVATVLVATAENAVVVIAIVVTIVALAAIIAVIAVTTVAPVADAPPAATTPALTALFNKKERQNGPRKHNQLYLDDGHACTKSEKWLVRTKLE